MAIELDIKVTNKGLDAVFAYVQLTNAIPIIFRLTDFNIKPGSTASLYIKKPSGLEAVGSAEVDGNNVIVTPTTQMFAEKGCNRGQIEIINGDSVLCSFPFTVIVAENLTSDSAVESSNEYTALQDIIRESQGVISDAESAASSATSAAGAANTAADSANQAKEDANTAAIAANTAAGEANSAASAADNAAKAANQSKEDADAAAQRANDAAEVCESVLDVESMGESTEPADDDAYLFGAGGTNVIKKIKWGNILAKLKSILFANNLTTTQEGYGLDARQGKALKDEIDQINTNMRYLKKFEYSPISLQANVTKSVTIPISGLSGRTIDAAIVTLRGGIPYMASINSIDSSSIEVGLRSDIDISNRMIEVYVFYH